MKSRWIHLKESAVSLRKAGNSVNAIEAKLGIPRSTLSGWFKLVKIDPVYELLLQRNKEVAWAKALTKAQEWHKSRKSIRIASAEQQAQEVLQRLEINKDLLELAFAMLYLGEGAKKIQQLLQAQIRGFCASSL